MKDRRLRVGYVGAAFGTYYADEHDQYGRAVGGLRRLADEMDFDLIAVDTGVQEVEQARQAAARMSSGAGRLPSDPGRRLRLRRAAGTAGGRGAPDRPLGDPGAGAGRVHPAAFAGLGQPLRLDHPPIPARPPHPLQVVPRPYRRAGHGQAAPRDHPGPPGDQDDGLGAYRVDRRCLAGLLQHAVRRGEAGGAVRYEDRPPLDRRGGRPSPRRRRAVGGLGGADGRRPGRRG